jgi:hypothetical protein
MSATRNPWLQGAITQPLSLEFLLMAKAWYASSAQCFGGLSKDGLGLLLFVE